MSLRSSIETRVAEIFGEEAVPFAVLLDEAVDSLEEIYLFFAEKFSSFDPETDLEDASPELLSLVTRIQDHQPIAVGKISGATIFVDFDKTDDPIFIDKRFPKLLDQQLQTNVYLYPEATAAIHRLENIWPVESWSMDSKTGAITIISGENIDLIEYSDPAYHEIWSLLDGDSIIIGNPLSNEIWFDMHLGFISADTGELLSLDNLPQKAVLDPIALEAATIYLEAKSVFMRNSQDIFSPIVVRFNDQEEREINLEDPLYQALSDIINNYKPVTVGHMAGNDEISYSLVSGYMIYSTRGRIPEAERLLNEQIPVCGDIHSGERIFPAKKMLIVTRPGLEPRQITQNDPDYHWYHQLWMGKTGVALIPIEREVLGTIVKETEYLAVHYNPDQGIIIEQWPKDSEKTISLLKSQRSLFEFPGGLLKGTYENPEPQPTRRDKKKTERKKLPHRTRPKQTLVFRSGMN